MQKDDVIIRKAIVHIMDIHQGYLGLSDSILEPGPDLNDFIRDHIYKLISSDDIKKCRFSEDLSPVYSMLDTFDESNEEEFINISKKMAELFFEVMSESMEIPSADLVVASFQIESTVHLAFLKMNYKENFVHAQLEGNQNDIVKERIILPSGSSRLTEAAVVNLKTMELCLIEKKYEIQGEKVNYLSERVLHCHTDLPSRKKFNILTKAIQDINNKYSDTDINEKMEAKSILQQEFVENQEFNVNEIGDKIFALPAIH